MVAAAPDVVMSALESVRVHIVETICETLDMRLSAQASSFRDLAAQWSAVLYQQTTLRTAIASSKESPNDSSEDNDDWVVVGDHSDDVQSFDTMM